MPSSTCETTSQSENQISHGQQGNKTFTSSTLSIKECSPQYTISIVVSFDFGSDECVHIRGIDIMGKEEKDIRYIKISIERFLGRLTVGDIEMNDLDEAESQAQ
ncbi:unnamed protein product [Adineta ricciae]|uniref:Uncharacterized protein n=1 Tax=Adineta ricciae TaxID=249248 RepID=A0A815QHA5_ADIRI|nr:unnamed protein product [Adineta ricciae]CAF1463992.1 unnamed protein product [Adineta ricciae]